MNKLIFASSNPGMIEEIDTSFQKNAAIKVSAVIPRLHGKDEYTDAWIAGEDSGITIDALAGKPRLHTRRWAGHRMPDSGQLIGTIADHVNKKHLTHRQKSFKAVFEHITGVGS